MKPNSEMKVSEMKGQREEEEPDIALPWTFPLN